MAVAGRPFTVTETHGILLRPEHRIIAASDRLGWKSLYASMQREAPYAAAYAGVPDHLIILHLDDPVTVSRVLGKSWASRVIPPGGLFMLPGGVDFGVNDIRRIYTDGRGHTPEDEAYPLWNGDSIGFWDGDSLVIHTNQLMAGQYQRSQPDYTDQVETVERWRKVDDNTIAADVTIYDPPALIKPWHVVQTYSRVTTPSLRIRSWVCEENANNEVYQTKEGATRHVLPGPGAGPIVKSKTEN